MHFKRILLTAGLAVGLLAPIAADSASAAPIADISTNAEADAYIAEGSPTTAFGSTDPTHCKVQPGTGIRMQCRFRVNVTSLLPGDTITGATVKAYVQSGGGTKTMSLSQPSTPGTPWSETTLTWANRQTQPAAIATAANPVNGQELSWTLPVGTVTGNGSEEFSIWNQTGGSGTVDFATKETGGVTTAPRLVLSVDRPATPVPAIDVKDASGASITTAETGDVVTADACGSTDADNDIDHYVFDFGDGSTTISQAGCSATHTFVDGGNYVVAVDVFDSGGRHASASFNSPTGLVVTHDPDEAVAYGWNANGGNLFNGTTETATQWHDRQVSTWSASSVGGYQAGKIFKSTLPLAGWDANNEGLMDGHRVVITFGPSVSLSNMAAGGDDTRVTDYIASIPDGWDVTLCLINEVDLKIKSGSVNQAQWEAAFDHLLQVVRGASHEPNTRVGLWASITTTFTSGYTASQLKALMPDDVDGFSIDNYFGNPAGQGGTGYNSLYSPTVQTRTAGTYDFLNMYSTAFPISWDEVGAPWRIPDTDASDRDDWMTGGLAYLASGYTHTATSTHVQPRRILVFNCDGTLWTQSFLADNAPSVSHWDQGVRPTDPNSNGDEPFVEDWPTIAGAGAVDPFDLN